ncbi:MAG TPA: NUDIX hydrolase [Acetobacteraceae bacterium]
MTSEPDWLLWAREIQAIAQTGLAFDPPQYDKDRYLALQALAARMVAARCGGAEAEIEAIFAGQAGYATPKIEVRGAVFRDGRILLVREVADRGRWTLPGGWGDVGLTPAENIVKEVLEESGFAVRATKLAALLDHSRQGHPPAAFHAYKLFFLCEIIGGAPAISHETSEVAFFAEDALPEDLSVNRVTRRQIARMFAHARDPRLPTEFE